MTTDDRSLLEAAARKFKNSGGAYYRFTPWFRWPVRPVRVGEYEWRGVHYRTPIRLIFNGTGFGYYGPGGLWVDMADCEGDEWRGLTLEAAAMAQELAADRLASLAAAQKPEQGEVDMRALCEMAMRAEFAFPPLPPGIVAHPKLGDLFDRLQAHQYGLRVAEAMLKAAIVSPPAQQPAEPTMLNGLTEAEARETASVAGLSEPSGAVATVVKLINLGNAFYVIEPHADYDLSANVGAQLYAAPSEPTLQEPWHSTHVTLTASGPADAMDDTRDWLLREGWHLVVEEMNGVEHRFKLVASRPVEPTPVAPPDGPPAARGLRATATPSVGSAGWQLVPEQPTKGMLRAAVTQREGSAVYRTLTEDDLQQMESEAEATYAAMLDAAPRPPQAPDAAGAAS